MFNQIAYSDPKQLKRDIRGVVLGVGAFLMTMSVVSVIVVVVAVFIENAGLITSAISTNPEAMANELNDTVMDALERYSGLASVLGMLLGLPWFFLLRGKNFLTRDVTHTNSRVNIGTIALMLVLIMGVQFLMTLIQIGLEPLFSQTDASATDVLDESITSLGSSIWGMLYVVIIGPICEELVFRGAVMRKLEKYGANFAIIVSSLLFGLYHIILFQAMFAFLIGIVLAYTAGRFSIKWAMVLHIINNGMAMLSLVLNSEIFNTALNITYAVSLIVSIVIIVTVGRSRISLQKRAGAPSEPRVYERAFSSPWLIVYIAITVLGGVSLLGLF